ncbi:MAG: Ni/Fe-hydrogenase cytochrome b subunit [Geothrix sp.]|uniref:NrfD/PsrC family molybdoenzyme membrane anchor subunit n=1 Tax=Geothrix sp. TaxID=1962974 RepID=UPI0017A9ECC0|nr:Ni/Fe-hydrogenase cytochrome b subunit [Geothrix sp.]NWJ40901.1 Ni/Fe-hydrogenase cytochrome b subunit [Geothrix sp.]WIL21099.1 MAG: Ni/Fe-hydrogenase cytochrome b subunit [Geothrix sp.]
MKGLRLPHLTGWRPIATILILAGILAAVARFTLGLGATTNLSDEFPWGLWIGFDFLGIGLAASGFTIVAAVHLFHAEEYEPIVRPAILTAFIGYLLVVLVLIIDLGRPDHFWHPLVMWNPHSVMCEISWCLMLYTTVLSLEFAPIILEKFHIHSPIKWIHAVSLPFMIFGVLLSTLHQSSFGSLYLIVPNRLHALWYTPLLPVLFFISCIASGLSMIVLESIIFSRDGRPFLPTRLRANLAKAIALALAVYFVVRIQDLLSRGGFRDMTTLSYYSVAFWGELLIGFVIPFAMLLFERIRVSQTGLYSASLMVVLGFAFNRMNTAITGLEHYPSQTYFPSIIEIFIMLGITACGFCAFSFIAERLPIFRVEESGDPFHHEALSGVQEPLSESPECEDLRPSQADPISRAQLHGG